MARSPARKVAEKVTHTLTRGVDGPKLKRCMGVIGKISGADLQEEGLPVTAGAFWMGGVVHLLFPDLQLKEDGVWTLECCWMKSPARRELRP